YVVFILEMTGDARHAHIDFVDIVTGRPGCCVPELFATRPFKSAHELFETLDQLQIPGLLTMCGNNLIAFGFAQGVFKPLQYLVYLIGAVTTAYQVERFCLNDVCSNAAICFVCLTGPVNEFIHLTGVVTIFSFRNGAKWRGRLSLC